MCISGAKNLSTFEVKAIDYSCSDLTHLLTYTVCSLLVYKLVLPYALLLLLLLLQLLLVLITLSWSVNVWSEALLLVVLPWKCYVLCVCACGIKRGEYQLNYGMCPLRMSYKKAASQNWCKPSGKLSNSLSSDILTQLYLIIN